jgi:hypothetical protein
MEKGVACLPGFKQHPALRGNWGEYTTFKRLWPCLIARRIAVILNIDWRSKMPTKKDLVQTKNPKSGHYVKIDRSEGKIVDHKTTKGPYKNIPIIRKKSK